MKIKLTEQFTIDDLDRGAISDLTADYLFDRVSGSGLNRNVLHQVTISNDFMYVWYRTYPTYGDESNPKRVAYGNNFVPTEHYDSIFQFQGVGEHLGTKQSLLAMTPQEQLSVMKDFINRGSVRTHCNCGAYLYQGHWERNAGADSSVFPFTAPRGKGIWQAKHNAGLTLSPKVSVCKHVAASIYNVDRDAGKVLKMVLEKLA
jgi:hypothetical protein